MCCSASGSIRSQYQAWLPAPPRCSWSTGAREPGGSSPKTKASRLSSEGFCTLEEAVQSALRFLGGLFFLFDRRPGGYFRRRRGARHWVCRRCRNGLLVVHIGPPRFVEAVTIAGFADV